MEACCKGSTALAASGHELTGPSILDAAHAWLALLPWPDLGVAWLLLSCEVKEKRAYFPYNRASFSCLWVFQMQKYFNYIPSTQEIN